MEVTCRVCSQEYSGEIPSLVPRNLSCGHSFCTGCIAKLVRSSMVQCPFRCVQVTMAHDVSALPKCFGILDILKARSVVGASQYRSAPMLSTSTVPGHYQASFISVPSVPVSSLDARPPPFNPAAAAIPNEEPAYYPNAYPVGGEHLEAPGIYPGGFSSYGSESNDVSHYGFYGSTNAVPVYSSQNTGFKTIIDKFSNLAEVQNGLRSAGLESSNLIIAIDYTKSNTWTGEKTFGGRCLHWTDPSRKELNPYQSVISVIGRTLQAFDDDNLIPVFGFGDRTTGDKSCFPFYADGSSCQGFEGVIARYNEITPNVVLAGPTNFAPVIREAMRIVCESRSYHILVIIADGQVTSRRDTETAIVEASRLPLSIIVVGVGDGPWEVMEEFDDGLPARVFDNFQFVQYHKIAQGRSSNEFDAAFATAALMEIPDQYLAIKQLNLI